MCIRDSKYIVKYMQEHGAEWFFEHTGVVLIQADDRTVMGLIARNTVGEYINSQRAKVLSLSLIHI